MNDPDDVMGELDGLSAWIHHRDQIRRHAATAVVTATAVAGLLALLDEAWLFVPLIPPGAAVLWLAGEWALDCCCQAWSARAGHPIVWAEVPWTLASHRPLPPGWAERAVPGTLHRTGGDWAWQPSALFAEPLPQLRWSREDVAVATLTPLWSPSAPSRAQLRLYLRSGGTAELLVWQPSRLRPLKPADSSSPG